MEWLSVIVVVFCVMLIGIMILVSDMVMRFGISYCGVMI